MKYARIFVTLLFMVALVLSVTACKKHPPEIQPKPTAETATVPETTSVPPPQPEKPLVEGAITDATLAKCTSQLQPVFYDYNKSDIREDQINALQNNARVLKSEECAPASLLIEGHCDERGTEEYNLALGERRARSSKDYLVSLGIAESRVSTISYGESKPFAEGHNEEAWQQNRRAQFVALKK